MDKELVRHSKALSYYLRHRPDKLGIRLDTNGWVAVETLLEAMRVKGKYIDLPTLQKVVAQNSKKRFAFSHDGVYIRANQGHSVPVDLGYQPTKPPQILYHGTVAEFIPSIREKGLVKGNRHHVHLSEDKETAREVGGRRGEPIVLPVHSGAMNHVGHEFFMSDNGVWLTEEVAPTYIIFDALEG